MTGFPTAIPFGWWHSHTKRSQKEADEANGKKTSSKKNKSALERGRDEYLGYYVMNPADSRSARLFTAEFIATEVRERRRMAAKVDSIFAAVKDDTKIVVPPGGPSYPWQSVRDRKSTRLNSSHSSIIT